jgi:LemA protein
MTLLAVNDGIFVLVLIGFAVLLPVIWLIATFNRFVRLRQHIKESWADIDVELKRRHDLIPNLVETVRGYASHERVVLEKVIELRNRAAAAHPEAGSLAKDESALMMGLKQVFVIAEAYPSLKADGNFLSLQRELANTEDRIAAARRFYNGNIRDLNGLCQQFPTNMVAGVFGFTPGSFFELSGEAERVVPRLNMGPFTQPGLPG